MFDLIYCGTIEAITGVECYGPETSKSINVGESSVSQKNFLTLWKNADPDIPILNDAKAEYAKLP